MKISTMFLCLLLIVVTVGPGEPAELDEGPLQVSCCYSVTTRRIPFNRLKSYTKVSTQCHLPAVIFKTKRGINVCADSKQDWVNIYMKLLDRKSQTLQA